MSAFTTVLHQTLAGAQRQTVSVDAPGAVGEMLRQIASSQDEPALQLLRMAGALDVCEKSGFTPDATASGFAWPVASEDPKPPVSEQFCAQVLRHVLSDVPERLQIEVLTAMAQAGLRLPHKLLPSVLELGRRSTALRPAIIAVAGERGRWLGTRNPAWRFAAGASVESPLMEQWEHGSTAQRRLVFEQSRKADPAAARTLFATEMAQMPAKERVDLLPLFSIGLGADDESLLDTCLKDRSKDVRPIAATLLQALPNSRHARLIVDALAPLLTQQRGLLGILGTRWEIDAPQASVASWKDEAIEVVRPSTETLGERAWWLFQLVRQAPLGWWTAQTGMSPDALLAWAEKSDWKAALLRGWRVAAIATSDAAWALALTKTWDGKVMTESISKLLALLPLPVHEPQWSKQLSSGEPTVLATVLTRALGTGKAGQQLSPAFSAELAQAMLRELRRSGNDIDHHARYRMPEAVCLLDRSAIRALSPLPRTADVTPSETGILDQIDNIVHVRLALADLHAANPSLSSNGIRS